MNARQTNKGEKMVIAKQYIECECGEQIAIENHLDIDVSVSMNCPASENDLIVILKPVSVEKE